MGSDSDALGIRQNTAYGIGVVARALPPAQFKTLLPGCQRALELVLSHPEANGEEAQAATENAWITVGVLALLHTQDQS